ncbi:hypothetical protein [Romboutsia lituseburensis]|uniref:Uncharacterized protein n=1 Tax=Romboutsia lituseburensis DSM 797 TaxID=1121325 RepID=A0A1G9IMK0_9FIRM|nr:hypothetical protein [Romboutsia lituseburensis]CEH33841.1 Hypothetical protein RLITU_1247 [Romboutsia lituseburensis]SDL26124.1 hypothetical protein SAMN04515677_101301 [Romboutsia lituseburensis DSM 797]
MNKRASKIVLVTTVGLMLLTTVSIGISNKENYEVIDINGNRSVLDNVNVVYQDHKGYYKTSEVKISKDNIEVKKHSKDAVRSLPLKKEYRENRDIFKSVNNSENMYKIENNIGEIHVSKDYKTSDHGELYANVTNRDLKSKKDDYYEIPLNYKFKNNNDNNSVSQTIVYNNELYVLVGIDKSPGYLDEEETVSISKGCLANIYKLDLENKSSELVASRVVADKDELSKLSYTSFKYENTLYFIKETIDNSNKDNMKKKFELMSYDFKNNKFNSEKMPFDMEANNNISNFYVEGDKVIFLTNDIANKNKLSMKLSTLDLKNKKWINQNEEYNISVNDNKDGISITSMRYIDNKLYLIIDSSEYAEQTGPSAPLNRQYLYVIDKNTKKNLYSGIIRNDSTSYVSPNILTNDEI